MRKLWIWVLAVLMLCGTAGATDTPQGVPYEQTDGYSSAALWEDAGTVEALRILQALGITPRWPGVLPEGFDPEAEPRVRILATRDPQGYSRYRTGEMLHSEQLEDGRTLEYWPVDASALDQPERIDLVFSSEAGDSHITLIYYMRTQQWMFSPGRTSARILEAFDQGFYNGMHCYDAYLNETTWGPLQRVFLYEDADLKHYEGNPADDERLVVAYEVRSGSMEMEPLMDIARGLVLLEEGP